MTLIFSGNDYKYEIEGVMKLFIPATLFKIVYGDCIDTDDDYVFTKEKADGERVYLSVSVKYNGKQTSREQAVSTAENADRELMLSRLLYSAMSELTGKKPKWGIITGVRPVKLVNNLINEGKSKEECFEILNDTYLCSKEKFDTAYLTASVQKPILDSLDDKSFSLYVSIPFCPTRCAYCSFVSQSVEMCMKQIPQYLENLCREIEYTGELVRKIGLKLDTVYFGGGTPTTLTAEQLEKLMKCIEDNFDLSDVREYTVEAGRPDTVTAEKFQVLKKYGCRRVSINPQTLNDKVLETIGRKHTSEQFLSGFELARKAGFDVINTDIIAGLPKDTPESFKHTVDKLIELSPENITVHTLSIKRAARLNHEDGSAVKNSAEEMVEYATKALLENGYKPYYLYRQKNMLDNLENIGWSKEGKENLYNIFIMEEVQTIIAVGAAGSTKLVDLKNKKLERVFNYKFPLEYNNHFELMLKRKEKVRDFYAEEK